MRNVTIRRRKVYSGCLGKAKIYIEDPLSPEITIGKVPCRKLGELKNGEEQTFTLGSEAARIFVISGKLSKALYNECFQIPAGTEDLTLTGQYQFTPAGVAFQFDNNDSVDVISKRKKRNTIGMIILIAACVLGFFAGKFARNALTKHVDYTAKEFTSHGITITLEKSFREDSAVNYTACFSSKDVAILALKESFTLMEGLEDYTLEEYGKLVLESNARSDSSLKTFGGTPGFEYDFTNEDTDITYHYRIYLYKSHDAFWLVQFVTQEDVFSKYESRINQWAQSVRFSK